MLGSAPAFKSSRPVLVLILGLALAFTFASCSGGGGDDGDEVSGGFSEDPCEAVGIKGAGIKVANGTVCPVNNPRGTSVVKIEMFDTFGFAAGSCSGVALTTNAVLTAGHCFIDEPGQVVVDTFVGGFIASDWSVHPGFGESGGVLINDAALVFTSEAMPIATSPLLASREPQVGEEAIVAGYGETEPGTGATDDLVAGNAWISDVSSRYVVIDFTEDQSHPCNGDSGGPLFVNVSGVQAVSGVVSQSDPSVPENNICLPGDQTIYTNVENSEVSAFIRGNVPGVSLR